MYSRTEQRKKLIEQNHLLAKQNKELRKLCVKHVRESIELLGQHQTINNLLNENKTIRIFRNSDI